MARHAAHAAALHMEATEHGGLGWGRPASPPTARRGPHLPSPTGMCDDIGMFDERTSARTSAFDETPRVCRCVISPHERGSSTQAWLVTRMETPASPETARSPETNSTPRDTRA
eukprot:CAMPEP_0119361744 /NCGR_PEP_ID=MMETSP1334-20130426/8995_1 /TAXON_ID=127549 /ORGANISM="Calcidiscus leptoporus, Strain RCC1130" /LENGTH=113 /DNA_ID=CAMNT_0007376841 /DNA_START=131 /DNA_END=470 /DNA_ORIENTATION=+